jgi:peptidyl-dipeptidase Dcp
MRLALLALAGTLVSSLALAKPNPLLAEWHGHYGGYPAFDTVRVADFKPAFAAAMASQLAEIDKIARNRAPASFDNTLLAMEKSGAVLNRVSAIYAIWSSTQNSGEFQAVQSEMDPKIAAFNDKITQNSKLFARIDAVYAAREKSHLSAEQQRLAWVYYNNFVRQGAKLDVASKKRVAAINERLAALFANFNQNLLADENDYVLYLKSEADLGGLSDSQRSAAAAAAEERGHKGEWAILNTRSSMEPFLTNSARRDLREKVWRTYYARGDNGDKHDNNKLITEILALRAERAKLLGFATHAHWRVADQMAKTPEAAMNLMLQVWPAAVARVHEEVAAMQAIADKEGAGRLRRGTIAFTQRKRVSRNITST